MNSRTDNIIQFPGEAVADVRADAASWFARLTSGSLTLGELAEFEFWRIASPDHDRIFREIEAMWDGLGAGTAPRGLHHRILAGLRRPNAYQGWPMRMAQLAAAVVAVVMLSHYLSTWRYDYSTAAGEIRHVALADGSVVYMKGGTALNVHVSGTGARSIDLARGEAFFEVRHDASRPFTVDVGSGIVRDIGTGFSVARKGQSATVAVEHGAVEVAASGVSDVLTKGQQLSFDPYEMTRTAIVDMKMIAAWRRGLYIAERKPLGQVLSELGEYSSRRIIVTSRGLAAHQVNAVVQLGHIDAWLDALNDTKGVSVTRLGPLIIVGDRKS